MTSTTKKRGIPSSALEVRELKAPSSKEDSKPEASKQASIDDQIHELNMSRKKVNNYRQPDALEQLIQSGEDEPLGTIKMKKVDLNHFAMLGMAQLSDEKLDALLSTPVEDLYRKAFDYYGYSKKHVDELIDQLHEIKQTTVEVNYYISDVVEKLTDRACAQPSAVSLYKTLTAAQKHDPKKPIFNSTEIRMRALTYFSALSVSEKIDVIRSVKAEHGERLNRLSDPQFKKKIERLQASA